MEPAVSAKVSIVIFCRSNTYHHENYLQQHKVTWVGDTQKRETQYFYPTIEHNTDYFKSFTLNGVRHLVGGGSGGGAGDDAKYLRHYTMSNSINEIGLGVCGYNQRAPLPWSIADADVISYKNESEGKNYWRGALYLSPHSKLFCDQHSFMNSLSMLSFVPSHEDILTPDLKLSSSHS